MDNLGFADLVVLAEYRAVRVMFETTAFKWDIRLYDNANRSSGRIADNLTRISVRTHSS
jgi:hypothetical protein